MPWLGMRDDFEQGRFVEVMPDFPSEPMHVSIVHPHGRSMPKRVRAVMTWLQSVIAPRIAA